MDNLKRYNKIFLNNFPISKSDLDDNFVFNSIEEWDSIGHMNLISDLEEEFNISMEMDDIIDFSSYKIGMELIKKYGIDI